MTIPSRFHRFSNHESPILPPEKLNNPFDYEPHALCLIAARDLQNHLENQTEWEHNFGLTEGQTGTIVGKMFGVLVVESEEHEIGYLCAFSGKLAGGNHHSQFVPPVYDALTEGSFLNVGMTELSAINAKIKSLEEEDTIESNERAVELKEHRKSHSFALQQKLFAEYHFLNLHGKRKNILDIFQDALQTSPPGGAGECAAPKLFQYAFEHQLKPLAIAEFWWGLSPKSEQWKHGSFYPACREKCGPILGYMLDGIEFDG